MSGSNKDIYYTAADIEKYLNGELSASEMHALEKASLDDPFLGDALEGMKKDRLERGTSFSGKDMPELSKRLEERIGKGSRKTLGMPSHYRNWRVAASVALLAGLGALSYFTFTNKESGKPSLAVNKGMRQEEKTASADTAAQNTATQKEHAQKTNTKKTDTPVGVHSRSVARSAGKAIEKKQAGNIGGLPAPARRDTSSFADEQTADKKTSKDLAEAMSIPLSSANNKNVFTGRVTGVDDKPIAFATIRLKGRPVSTVTDSSGLFRLYFSDPDTLANATISSAGYESLTTALRSSGEDKPDINAVYSNQIHLRPADMALNDVVVTGPGISKKTRAMIAQSPPAAAGRELMGKVAGVSVDREQKILVQYTAPSVGWALYSSYLAKNKKIGTADSLLTGNEVISFLVNRKGEYSSFRIEHSLSAAHDAEAIRLVKEGPAWRLLKGKKERATLIVPF